MHSAMYKVMKKIIVEKRTTAQDCEEKIDTFYAFGRLTKDEYTELVALIKEVYGLDGASEVDSPSQEESN